MMRPESLLVPQNNAQSYWMRVLLVASVAFLLAIVLLFPFPLSGRHWSEAFNLAHAPAFLVVFLLVAGLCDPVCIGFPKSWHSILPLGTLRVLVLASVLLVLGVGCEVLQGFVERSPSLSDVVANGCGLVAGMFWCLSRQSMAPAGRMGLSLIAGRLLLAASWSPILELYDCYLQHQDFPVLASFERPRELHIWCAKESIIRSSTAWSTMGSASMRVEGSAGTMFSGACLQWPIKNWDKFTALEMDVFNPGDKHLTLRISIADNLDAASDHAPTDCFGTSVELPSQKQVHVRIELAAMRHPLATRPMDITQIESLDLLIVRPETDVVFMVDSIRLMAF